MKRFFLITYKVSTINGGSVDGMLTLSTEDDQHFSYKDLFEKIEVPNKKIVVIINVYEFKNESDYKDYIDEIEEISNAKPNIINEITKMLLEKDYDFDSANSFLSNESVDEFIDQQISKGNYDPKEIFKLLIE